MKKIIVSLIFVVLTYSLLQTVSAQENTVCIDFFYSTTCPHCSQEKAFLRDLQQKYPLKINLYEVSNSTNAKLFQKIVDIYGVSPDVAKLRIVPTIFIGEEVFVGFAEGDTEIYNPKHKAYIGYSGLIEKTVKEYLENGNICLSETIETNNNSFDSRWIVMGLIIVFGGTVFVLYKLRILKIKVKV